MAQGKLSPLEFEGTETDSFTAMQFTSDFKLGHYMKIPPRPMFWCQVRSRGFRHIKFLITCFSKIVATVIAGTVQLGVQSWMFSNIP